MTEEERKALGALSINWAPTPDDVWRPAPFHVEALHQRTAHTVLNGMAEAKTSGDSSPIGIVILGQKGAGKTHLLGWVRERVQEEGGYFFLVSLLDASGFWRSVVVSMLDGLSREVNGQESQLRIFLRRLSSLVGAGRTVRRAVVGDTLLTRAHLDAFIEALWRLDRQVGRECQDTARALVLRACDDLKAQDIGDNFLLSADEEESDERSRWGMRRGQRSAQEIVKDLSRLLALTGPSIVAVDQIDTLIAQSAISSGGEAERDWRRALMLEEIAGGLMSLREVTRRTLTVVACLPVSWALIRDVATDAVRDRFREAIQLKTIPSAEVGRALIEKRFAAHFREVGFEPPYPTWPVRPSAFDDAPDFTPRQLLIKIDGHIRSCLLVDEVEELAQLGPASQVDPTPAAPDRPRVSPQDLAALDARFAELKEAADVDTMLASETEDAMVPVLLSAGLNAWIAEHSDSGRVFTQDAAPSAKPALHARLRRILDENTEDEAHWGFRAIGAKHAVAALNRLRAASTMAGLTEGITKRRLFLLRNVPWSAGPATQKAVAAFEAAGGRTLPVSDEDLKTLAALCDLLAESPTNLPAWLAARRPTSGVSLFHEALADASTDTVASDTVASDGIDGVQHRTEDPPVRPSITKTGVAYAPCITIGKVIDGDRAVRVDLEALRKHAAIFAGSGSGKTVLIRRLVEECALQGVSAIVLDPNNDLARLGDAWPAPPPLWGEGDAARAEEYLANTDVVVWTPRRAAGRPLSFQPLPDFASVVEDADEFGEAVEAAVASIAPRAKLDAKTTKAHLGQAVLRKALEYYGRRGSTSLKGFIDVLSELPGGVSELDNAKRIAADMAQTLTAAMVNDPLFGGDGAPVDPGLLLTPPPGKRARVSVISLVGLPSDDQRQSFVNQLQMALFAWIKKHPAGDRPLGGLFVMDEAQTLAPSGAMTACTQSTLALASQARKYGLGLVFATQAPKGLHNRIPGNASTQLFGLLNSPIQIAAAKEMAQAKGSEVPDISRLRTGQFYAAVEGSAFEKLQTPLCLSYHPKSPLTTEEVIERARGAA